MLPAWIVAALASCVDVDPGASTFGEGTGAADSGTSAASGSASTRSDETAQPPDTSGTQGETDTGSPIFDVGVDTHADDTGPPSSCKVGDELDAIGDCEIEAPPESFEPALQWAFGQGTRRSWVTPLVANLTDDNADGSIDLCDVPDVVLVAGPGVGYGQICSIHVLDGATGIEHFEITPSEGVSCTSTPALGDIDDDGLPELVALWNDAGTYRVKTFEHDGTPKWTNTTDGDGVPEYHQYYRESGAVALHDLDADGDVEIVFNHEAYDHEGTLLWEHVISTPGEGEASVGVDLDGDGMMEVVTGHSAYHHDGTLYFDNYPPVTRRSIPQIGNLDDDPQPEIVVTSENGLYLFEHDGTVTYGPVRPTGVPADYAYDWLRPATIHDFDGDGAAEWASAARTTYAVYRGPTAADVLWQVTVEDISGSAGSTAFDFLGDGVAEAMYADEYDFRIYDGLTGAMQLEQPRRSLTITEYPVVADIDNDGSAEILVVSQALDQPAVQAIRDVEDRWIQARRIWNQHAYYVTNVREDSTIPQTPVNNWETLNTYRTNAQIEGGALCDPEPEG